MPAESTLNLPLPPSVNRLISKRGNASPVVEDWIRHADAHLMLTGQPIFPVHGEFEIDIVWDVRRRRRRADIDNRIKPLLDYLQRISVIDNDRDCVGLRVRWGQAPAGCYVRLRATGSESHGL